VLGVALVAPGCAIVPAARINDTCRWSQEPSRPLDLRARSDRTHLTADAVLAEELAIRFADATAGFRSGHYAGADAYAAARERCLTRLLGTVADAHAVAPAVARDAIRHWSILADALFFEERVRLQTNHLSYRAFYVPWAQHPVIAAAAGAVVFLLAVVVRAAAVGHRHERGQDVEIVTNHS
jgi:hypothetical protein